MNWLTKPSLSARRPSSPKLQQDKLLSNLCKVCAEYEATVLRRTLLQRVIRQKHRVNFQHYLYFHQIVSAAKDGCQLCTLFEQGYIYENVRNPPKERADVRTEAEVRQWLLDRDALYQDVHANESISDRSWMFTFSLCQGPGYIEPDAGDHGRTTAYRLSLVCLHRHSSGPRFGNIIEQSAQFMLCTDADDPALRERLTGAREVSLEPDLKLAADWIDRCCRSHACAETFRFSSDPLPGRLIEIRASPDPATNPSLKVVTPGNVVKYAALSYRWSENMPGTSLQANIRSRHTSVPYETLPLTIRDAIRVTLSLGLNYLWVDAICIVQDDVADFEVECAKMGTIYSNAFVTVAAAAAVDASCSLVRRQPHSPLPTSCQLIYRSKKGKPKGHVKAVFIDNTSWEERVSGFRSPLSTRGWTLQERLLSPRVLSFNRDKMGWECMQSLGSESLHYSHRHEKSYGSLSRDSIQERTGEQIYYWWADVVEDFLKRKLTQPMDTLPALSGIARYVQSRTTGRYLAGIWEATLATQMVWYGDRKHSLIGAAGMQPSAVPEVESHPYRAPTWSWARSGLGPKVPSFPYDWLEDTVTSHVSFVRADVEAQGQDPWGKVKPGSSLTIKAPLLATYITTSPRGFSLGIRSSNAQDLDVKVHIDDPVTEGAFCDKDRPQVRSVYAAFISTFSKSGVKQSWALALTKVGESGEYRRIGLFAERSRYPMSEQSPLEHLFSDVQAEEVTIY